jgi:hypothetical protein
MHVLWSPRLENQLPEIQYQQSKSDGSWGPNVEDKTVDPFGNIYYPIVFASFSFDPFDEEAIIFIYRSFKLSKETCAEKGIKSPP